MIIPLELIESKTVLNFSSNNKSRTRYKSLNALATLLCIVDD